MIADKKKIFWTKGNGDAKRKIYRHVWRFDQQMHFPSRGTALLVSTEKKERNIFICYYYI